MENQEFETMQPEQEPAVQPEAAEEARPETVAESVQPETEKPAENAPQGFYHGTGAGRTEVPFGASPYVTYHYPPQQPYQLPKQPWQQPQQPWQQPQQPVKPVKKKKDNKLPIKIVAALLAIILVAVGCGVSVILINHHWKNQFALLSQRFDEQLAVIEQQLHQGSGEGGQLAEPGQQLSVSQIYEQNVKSVVAITATVSGTENGQLYEGISAGTGFIITEDGYVVTNHHVVNDAQKITVTMSDGTEYTAKPVGSNATNDVALLQMQNVTGLTPVKMGSSSAMQVGDQVVAIGNALGELSSSLTVGYVSGIDRDIATDGTIINMIQTDAAINSGNSGGPLFNAQGQVIGITTAKYSGTTSSGASIEGISFAIPIDDVWDMLEDLMEVGYIRTAYLGVMVRNMDPEVVSAYGLPMGVYVNDVTAGSCAQKAGVRSKDIIIGLGGYEVENMNDLSRALRAYEPGETVTLTVWRGGAELILSVTLDGALQN